MKLKAPKDIVAVKHIDTQYDVDEHGHVEVHEQHVNHFIEMGFTVVEAEEAATEIEKAPTKPWEKQS